MRIILSPAKKMREDTDSLAPAALPVFLEQAEQILAVLQAMDDRALQKLWRCNDKIAAQNIARLRHMDLRGNLTPAILSYVGLQYQYMAPGVFEETQYRYLQERLRIVSGFYGLLRPFDGVTPYRLEMQARLRVGGAADLYSFWGNRLASRLAGETDWVLNLASREYSQAVLPHLPDRVQAVTCVFAQRVEGRLVEKGTLCKMARGEMVRWLAEEQVDSREALKGFDRLGYRYDCQESAPERLVFVHCEAQ